MLLDAWRSPSAQVAGEANILSAQCVSEYHWVPLSTTEYYYREPLKITEYYRVSNWVAATTKLGSHSRFLFRFWGVRLWRVNLQCCSLRISSCGVQCSLFKIPFIECHRFPNAPVRGEDSREMEPPGLRGQATVCLLAIVTIVLFTWLFNAIAVRSLVAFQCLVFRWKALSQWAKALCGGQSIDDGASLPLQQGKRFKRIENSEFYFEPIELVAASLEQYSFGFVLWYNSSW